MKRSGVYIIAGLALLAFAAGLVTAGNKETPSTRRAVLKVESMTCTGCFYSINSSLKSMEGFSGMGTNLFRKMVAVDFNAPLTPEAIQKAVTKLGYPATVEAVETVTTEETFAFLESRRQKRFGGSCCSGGNIVAPKTATGACPGAGASQRCPYGPGTAPETKQKAPQESF